MTTVVNRLVTRHRAHVAGTPTFEMVDVWLAYAAGVNVPASNVGRQLPAESYALAGVNMTVTAGEHVALVGPNGAGKSTLFRLVAGTLRPTQGQVNVYGSEPASHICVAYVPQRAAIDWSFPVSVADVVMMGRIGRMGFLRWPRRHDWAVVEASLERVGMATLTDHPIGELSGGQQQRVFIARALAQRADLVLLDEPFSGLDAPSHDSILEGLAMLRRDGVSVVVATHDLSLAAERFQRIVLLNRRIVADGPPQAVLTADHLLEAYGSHTHVLVEDSGRVILADTCCDHTSGEPA
jgi:manganese/iron transport system ATP-binding protein